MTSRGARLAVFAAAMFVLGAACAGPKPPIEVGVKEFPINILLGGTDTPQPTRKPAENLYVDQPLIVPFDSEPFPTVKPTPRGPCPEFHPFDAPKYVAPNRASNPPVNDQTYSYRAKGENVPAQFTRLVTGVNPNRTFGNDKAYSFKTVDDYGKTKRTVSYLVVPESNSALPSLPNTAAGNPGTVGIYIEQISTETPGKPTNNYQPSTPLRVLHFPVEPGSATTSTATDPVNQTTLIVSNSTITTDKLKVNACGQPIDAFNQQINIRMITPSSDITMTGTWGWATQYGGLLVYEKVKTTGSVTGESEATINSLPKPPPGIF